MSSPPSTASGTTPARRRSSSSALAALLLRPGGGPGGTLGVGDSPIVGSHHFRVGTPTANHNAVAANLPPLNAAMHALTVSAASSTQLGSGVSAALGSVTPESARPQSAPSPLTSSAAVMVPGNLFRQYLSTDRIFICATCHCHLACQDDLISKSFQGVHGRAYLFNTVINFTTGPLEQRVLMTGSHTVADIFCSGCKTLLGWKYEETSQPSQRYKIGKFIIEKVRMVKENGWT
ncbi:yippee-like protein [Capsaspora owczarzaki ATCC 30864]|uniref:Yippee-like protein n=1 Tax=Capsaspora owczarzaki (strain ATCC 30864) TaxID=595528 RepID=A0A0D2URA3_CAPO3|nr:yippee-like protein [Capsaspora owczarzaki ATCC 30864]KJE97526.1 yippee-like protein [Capsaspora owczarzaki ATCC 30864]|eukprot:XP_004343227.1 yippee-like protein [Capsaspora owczarzaki ATCC 30864]